MAGVVADMVGLGSAFEGSIIPADHPELVASGTAFSLDPSSDYQSCCSCHVGKGSYQDNMVCMPLHVFVFCILVSALGSGIAVLSKRIWNKLREVLSIPPVLPSRPTDRSRRSSFRGAPDALSLEKVTKTRPFAEAAEYMDVAARVGPFYKEKEEKLPARYVRAFCGNEEHALQRWKSTLKWRKENQIDSILTEPRPDFYNIRRFFPSHMSGRSRGGHIVVYEKLGDIDMRTLTRDLGITVPALLRHWIFVSEYMYRILQPTDSAQQITVVDMNGVHIQSLAGKIQEYLLGAAQLARLYYVERCHKTFVVNTPAWFGLAFRVVSPFLSARTKQKIRILGSDFSSLQDEIEPQFLPVKYGGSNTVTVSDSFEERGLWQLVEANNATAVIPKTRDQEKERSSSGGKQTTNNKSHHSPSTSTLHCSPSKSYRSPSKPYRSPSTSRHSPSRTPTKKGLEAADERKYSSKLRGSEKASARNVPLPQTPAKATIKTIEKVLPPSATSNSRSRARTDDPAFSSQAARNMSGSDASRTLTPRRATWAGDGLDERAKKRLSAREEGPRVTRKRPCATPPDDEQIALDNGRVSLDAARGIHAGGGGDGGDGNGGGGGDGRGLFGAVPLDSREEEKCSPRSVDGDGEMEVKGVRLPLQQISSGSRSGFGQELPTNFTPKAAVKDLGLSGGKKKRLESEAGEETPVVGLDDGISTSSFHGINGPVGDTNFPAEVYTRLPSS